MNHTPKIGKTARRTPEHYHELAESRGFKWTGSIEPRNNSTKTTWLCNQNHEWSAGYSQIQQGFGCPYCSGRARKTPQDYIKLAEKRGFFWIGEFPHTVNELTTWQCQSGHVWNAKYSNIYSGRNCPYCAGKARKTLNDYYLLASQNEIEWISEVLPEAVNEPTNWRCLSCEYEWKTSWSHISQGTGCPKCAGNIPRTEAELHQIAARQGLTWIGEIPPGAKEKTKWMCSYGHIWETIYGVIVQGSGCPYCSGKIPKTEQDYHALANSKGYTLIGKVPETIHISTIWQCNAGHQWETSYHCLRNHGCPHCSGNAKKTEQDYHELAISNGYKWIGRVIVPVNTKTLWECSKGHQWETSYTNLSNGSRCHKCTNYINGFKASKPQIMLAEMLNGEINFRIGSKSADIALFLDEKKIAIEYDCWYWHKDKIELDYARVQEFISLGWRVLSIKTQNMLPDLETIEAHIEKLLDGDTYAEIIMSDWGKD